MENKQVEFGIIVFVISFSFGVALGMNYYNELLFGGILILIFMGFGFVLGCVASMVMKNGK